LFEQNLEKFWSESLCWFQNVFPVLRITWDHRLFWMEEWKHLLACFSCENDSMWSI